MKDFDLDALPEGHEAFLVFDGAVYATEVYLNGLLAGKHEWGYSPFHYRVTDLLAKRNRLFVLVENHLKNDRVPGEIYDWNNDGGLINPVRLVIVPAVYIENFRVDTHLDGDHVDVKIDLHLASRDAAATESVAVRLPELDLDQEILARVGQTATIGFRLPRDRVELWCPDHPRLYRIDIATRHETLADHVGLREIATRGQRILLNGEPIRLYGACTHAEYKDTGRAATPEGIQRLVNTARELGVNFLRCAHYPYAEAFGRALDRAGIMWWQEVPAYWLPNMASPDQTRRACGMMQETIRRDWNRASLIVWSVSNECCWRNPADHADNNYAYWYAAVPAVRQLDPSRLISCAEAGNHLAADPIWKPDQADEFVRDLDDADRWAPGHSDDWYQLFDILAANFYISDPGQARTAYTRLVDLLRPYNKPIILSEFGSMSLRGSDAPDTELGSEARHAAMLTEAYHVFADLPHLTGYCPWCLVDIRVPIHWRWYNRGEAVFRYGFLDQHWIKKPAVFEAVRQGIANLKHHHGD